MTYIYSVFASGVITVQLHCFYRQSDLIEFQTILFLLLVADFAGQFWNGVEQIGHQPDVGDLENGRFRVFVDGDDGFRIFHAGKMLNGARDADRNVQFGCKNFASLADLVIQQNGDQLMLKDLKTLFFSYLEIV